MEKIKNRKKLHDYIEKFQISNFFSEDISDYMDYMVLYHFVRNEYIFQSGETFSYFYFFLEGKAKIYQTLSNGKRLLLCFYENFNILGEVELFNSNSFTTNAQAIDDVYCIGIPRNKVREFLLDDPIFLKNISCLLAEKLSRITLNSSINQLYPLKNKLAGYISKTSYLINEENRPHFIFKENLSEIAELLGTSYRHLIRTLDQFCNQNILSKKKKYYEITDENQLKHLAMDLYK